MTRLRRGHPVIKHTKISGFVEAVEGRRWWARLYIDGGEYHAEMKKPLPSDMGEGNLFTIHTTKRGRTYIYWIRLPLRTHRQLKKARQEGRRLWRALNMEEAA